MKTKIIYISGGEIFDMADIRAAFETVRAALSLDKNTVLFGVPVDNEDSVDDFIGEKDPFISNADLPPFLAQQPTAKSTSVVENTVTEKPQKSKRAPRAKVVPITSVKNVSETPVEPISIDAPAETENAIPILSVLGAKSADIEKNDKSEIDEPVDVTTTNDTDATKTESDDVKKTVPDSEAQIVSITDMLADDTMPTEPGEKTLEELLESMTPLAADEKKPIPPVVESETDTDTAPAQKPEPTDDTDATLELLAAEFAESEDKIVTPTKTESRGKIGKLKNILPFKKVKRDDSGIMGDLFGWAGVANDEDFTVPGFFTNASSKK